VVAGGEAQPVRADDFEFSTRVANAINTRNLDDLKKLLPDARAAIRAVNPATAEWAPLVDLLARCVDFDWQLLLDVEAAVTRLCEVPLEGFKLTDLFHRDLAIGLVAFHRQRHDIACRSFQLAVDSAARLEDVELGAVSRYFLARAEWKSARYDSALDAATSALALTKHEGTRIVIRMLVAWLHFLRGDFEKAEETLGSVEGNSHGDCDWITQGDLLSFRGRLARTRGQYDDSLEHFKAAIKAYATFDPNYRNIARCHRNLAFVYRVQAVYSVPTNMPEAEARRWIAARQRFAEQHLDEADAVDQRVQRIDRRGSGTALTIRALLCVDRKDWNAALRFLRDPIISSDRNIAPRSLTDEDHIVLANARAIECIVHLGKPRTDATRLAALRASSMALEHALRTDNRRLIARAYLRRGGVLLTLGDSIAAQLCHDEASRRVAQDGDDYLRTDVSALQHEIDQAPASDSTLLVVTNGDIRWQALDKTLDSIGKKIICHVYEANGRNADVTRKELSIGAARVREAVGESRRSSSELDPLSKASSRRSREAHRAKSVNSVPIVRMRDVAISNSDLPGRCDVIAPKKPGT
jgi:tetratricopeptide (TPR) repeat protein